MATNRFEVIAAELERLAAEIASINAHPLEYLVDIDPVRQGLDDGRGMQAMVSSVARLNGRYKRGSGPRA